MRKLLGVLAVVGVFVGISALATPMPLAAGNGPVCKIFRRCFYEPDASCPPCYYLAPCGPHCGCRAIPGCKP